MSQIQRTTLYCTEGGSNKQYTIWKEQQGSGWFVNFQYGPVGGWLQAGSKTKCPVTQAEADKVYSKIVKEKKAKGYVEGGAAPAFTPAPAPAASLSDSGLRPMLLTPDTEESMESYLTDDGWAAQEKMNGIRLMVRVTPKTPAVGVNRRGLERPIPQILVNSLIGQNVVLDGELIGTTFHAFDILEQDGQDCRSEAFMARTARLEKLVRVIGSPCVLLVPAVTGEAKKRELVNRLKTDRKEGVVFKRTNEIYEPGRRDNVKKALAVKVKFYKAISPVVIGWKNGKQSVEVGLRDQIKGNEAQIVSVGWVTVPTKYVGQIEVGKPVRVRYLYATDGSQLYQAHLDPTDDGKVMADQLMADPLTDLSFQGKDE
jgi:bifunctional non-homologous end joining protein LigD